MEFTPEERMARLSRLIREDPDCQACARELEDARDRLESYTESLTRRTNIRYWQLPTCLSVYHGRVLELICREMRFPEEERSDT